jgi:hypothetical protein
MSETPPIIEAQAQRRFPHRLVWPGLLILIVFNVWLVWLTTRRPNVEKARTVPVITRPISLATIYNGRVTESTTVRDKNDNPNTLEEFPLGEHEFAGVRFSVNGIVQLNGRYPDRADGIAIERPCRRLHLLAGVAGKSPNGATVAKVILNYASGQRTELPIKYGEHISDWWWRPNEPMPELPLRVAWTGGNQLTRREEAALNLYLVTFDNPRPTETIRTIDLVSENGPSWPFFLGVTAE